jgi:signal transduction histidine kinase
MWGRVFEPFVQAEGAMSRRHQGTGLGLAITRRLVELHGGTISVKSAPGEGSVFTVRFPVERIEDVAMRNAG